MRTPLVLLASGCLLVSWLQAGAEPTRLQNFGSPSAPNLVIDWSLIAQNTIAPPAPAALLVFLSGQLVHSPLAHIAMYDAAVASPPYVQPAPGRGVFESVATTPVAGASLGTVRPWTMSSPDQFRPNGPSALMSAKYAKDWIETRDWGSRTSTLRSSFRETFERVAMEQELDVVETARLFAMGFTVSADGNIGCYDAK